MRLNARAPSVPGRTGIQRAPVRRAVSVRRGSITKISAPLSAAASSRLMSSGGESVAGLVPQTTSSSAFSISANMLISIRPRVTWGAIMAKET
jgi:hypothetical protein